MRKAPYSLRVLAGFGAQHLYSDVTPQRRVLRTINDAHPAFAELLGDSVAPNRATDKRHRYPAEYIALEFHRQPRLAGTARASSASIGGGA